MAGQVRHLKVKDGRFYARIAVPAALQPLVGRSELTVPLGGERRAALKLLPEAVAGHHPYAWLVEIGAGMRRLFVVNVQSC